jgi:hypothetical protein
MKRRRPMKKPFQLQPVCMFMMPLVACQRFQSIPMAIGGKNIVKTIAMAKMAL